MSDRQMKLYFYDKKLDKYHFLCECDDKLNRWEITRQLWSEIERVTEWDFNKSIFGDSEVTQIMFNGEANYGKRGIIYDLYNEHVKEATRNIKLLELLD